MPKSNSKNPLEPHPATKKMSDVIRAIRLVNGLTQKDISSKCGITPSLFGKYERGEINFTIPTLYNIANALGISFELFLFSYIQRSILTPKEDETHYIIAKQAGFNIIHSNSEDYITLESENNKTLFLKIPKQSFQQKMNELIAETELVKLELVKSKVKAMFLEEILNKMKK